MENEEKMETPELTTPEVSEEASEEVAEEESESCTGATDEMMELVAVSHILYDSKMYKPGEVLPTSNHEMNEAWLEAGTAVWKSKQPKAVKAVSVTAQAGMTGKADNGAEDILAGRVPPKKRKK